MSANSTSFIVRSFLVEATISFTYFVNWLIPPLISPKSFIPLNSSVNDFNLVVAIPKSVFAKFPILDNFCFKSSISFVLCPNLIKADSNPLSCCSAFCKSLAKFTSNSIFLEALATLLIHASSVSKSSLTFSISVALRLSKSNDLIDFSISLMYDCTAAKEAISTNSRLLNWVVFTFNLSNTSPSFPKLFWRVLLAFSMFSMFLSSLISNRFLTILSSAFIFNLSIASSILFISASACCILEVSISILTFSSSSLLYFNNSCIAVS